jgi:hypothetical protein
MSHACVGMSCCLSCAASIQCIPVDDAPRAPEPIYRKTCKRYDLPGHAHYLTFSCFHRRPFLFRDRTRDWMVDAIALTRERHRVELWAWASCRNTSTC